jgi:uncharacterized DUF497 family protein
MLVIKHTFSLEQIQDARVDIVELMKASLVSRALEQRAKVIGWDQTWSHDFNAHKLQLHMTAYCEAIKYADA